jgi:DNA-3-methyladenine glycosylase
MFLSGGHAYVYRSYGIHWCLNIVCSVEGVAGAVLIRALEPTRGVEEMVARRGVAELRLLCSGPGRLTQALGVTREHDGLRLDRRPFRLRKRSGPVEIVTGPRIGITKAVDQPWRYGLAGSRFLSRPFSASRA